MKKVSLLYYLRIFTYSVVILFLLFFLLYEYSNQKTRQNSDIIDNIQMSRYGNIGKPVDSAFISNKELYFVTRDKLLVHYDVFSSNGKELKSNKPRSFIYINYPEKHTNYNSYVPHEKDLYLLCEKLEKKANPQSQNSHDDFYFQYRVQWLHDYNFMGNEVEINTFKPYKMRLFQEGLLFCSEGESNFYLYQLQKKTWLPILGNYASNIKDIVDYDVDKSRIAVLDFGSKIDVLSYDEQNNSFQIEHSISLPEDVENCMGGLSLIYDAINHRIVLFDANDIRSGSLFTINGNNSHYWISENYTAFTKKQIENEKGGFFIKGNLNSSDEIYFVSYPDSQWGVTLQEVS
jgi:hypothetical protein